METCGTEAFNADSPVSPRCAIPPRTAPGDLPECGRIWIHTHPGGSALPSGTDEQTFARVFGPCDWAVMAILAREGATYARIRFAAGPGGAFRIPVEVDYETSFPAAAPDVWAREYEASVSPCEPVIQRWETGAADVPEWPWRDLAGAL